MSGNFLLYGANGYVGAATARLAVQQGLKPVLAGRNAAAVQALAAELGAECRVFRLEDSAALDQALEPVRLVLNCAGPYFFTAKQMVDGCLRTSRHYVDLSGSIYDFSALVKRDAEARARGIMLLPGAGFDVVPTDCLALHVKQRLPSATHLTLAWSSRGPTRALPPGTANTFLESARRGLGGVYVRRDGKLVPAEPGKSRLIDFGQGPVKAHRTAWGDVFTSFFSTGIPNMEEYVTWPEQFLQFTKFLSTVRPLLGIPAVRNFIRSKIPTGSTAEERARTRTLVWAEVEDDAGRKAVSRLYGPEGGLNWTVLSAISAVQKVLAGSAPPGFQTPAMAYGADFTMECQGVTREDVAIDA